MTTLDWVLALSGPSLVVAILLAAQLIKRKAQDRRAVELLLKAVKAAEPAYREQLLKKLSAEGSTDLAKLQALADRLIKGRREYFKQVLAALLDRKPTGLLAIESALQQYSELHLQGLAALARAAAPLPPPAPVPPVSLGGAAPPANASEATLRSENDRLRREVGLTLSALNNIFAEYAAMFGDEHTRRDMNLEEILASMQQLAAGEPPSPAVRDKALLEREAQARVVAETEALDRAGDPFAELGAGQDAGPPLGADEGVKAPVTAPSAVPKPVPEIIIDPDEFKQ